MIYTLSWLPFALLIVLLVLRPLLSKIVVLPDGSYEVDTGESSAIVPIAGMGIAGSIMVGALMNWGAISAAIEGGTPATPPPGGAGTSFTLTLYDMDYTGASGDTLFVQGFPMPMGAIDTAHVVDSVEITVEGAEVGLYATSRGGDHSAGNQMVHYPDGSARTIWVQFRADPATETTGTFCYSGCTVDSVRISEVTTAWPTGDTTFAAINSGDSTGIRIGTIGYHPFMAFATDSAWLVDAYPFPLATIEEAQAITGTAAMAVDTSLQRIRDYADLIWDSTTTARISGDTPEGAARVYISILTNGTGAGNGCQDWTASASNFGNFRFAAGNSQNAGCLNANFYDWSSTLQKYGIMRHADSVGVEMLRRSFALVWWDQMYYTARVVSNGCGNSNHERRPVAMSLMMAYMFTGDDMYRWQAECAGQEMTGASWTPDLGDADGWYEGRIIGFAMNWAVANAIINPSAAWEAKLDTIVTQATNGREATGAPAAYSNGIWGPDSATAVTANESCTGTWNANSRPTNSFMHAIMVQALLRAYWYREQQDTFTVSGSADTTIISATVAEVADTFSISRGLWVDSTASYFNWFNGNNCSDPYGASPWTNNAHDIAGIHAITQYAEYLFDAQASVLQDADSTLQRIMVSRLATTQFSNTQNGLSWNVGQGIREYIMAEHFHTFLEALGWRNYTQGH